jgi:hypothetical protein
MAEGRDLPIAEVDGRPAGIFASHKADIECTAEPSWYHNRITWSLVYGASRLRARAAGTSTKVLHKSTTNTLVAFFIF